MTSSLYDMAAIWRYVWKQDSFVWCNTTTTTTRISLESIENWLEKQWVISDCNWARTHNYLVHKRTLNHLAKLAKWLSCVVSTYLYRAFNCIFLSCHIRIQSESTLYDCQNVKELLARSRCEIWSLSDCNWARTHNHLVHKRTLNHLAELAKWFSYVVSTYLYGAFDSIFLSCHVPIQSESIFYTLQLPECQGVQLQSLKL